MDEKYIIMYSSPLLLRRPKFLFILTPFKIPFRTPYSKANNLNLSEKYFLQVSVFLKKSSLSEYNHRNMFEMLCSVCFGFYIYGGEF